MSRMYLSDILDLELAWKRIKRDQHDDILPDILEYRDIDHDISTTMDKIKESLDSDYDPSELLIIDVPKRGYTLRPGSNMTPEDRIIYQAIVDFISGNVEEPPTDGVFSYRLNSNMRSNKMFKFWRPLWLEMRKKMREIYAEGYRCLLRTDIAAYFEHIDHDILRANILDGQITDQQVLDLLNKLLRKWAVSDVRYIGIPQGCDASSFIGNLYLINLDKIMIRGGFKYFRYSDEIYVLTKDEWEARKAIKLLINELRKFHLNLQEAKTDIITDTKKIADEIGTPEEDKTREFDYGFQRELRSEKIEESEEEIIKRYKKVTMNGRAKEVDVSKFKWCINRLHRLKSDKAVNFLLRRFAELPFLADLSFKYLQIFVNRKHVKEEIVKFLNSQDNIYQWQEMWLFFTLSKANAPDNIQLGIIRKIIRDTSKHWASRAAAILVLGKLGDDTDRNWFRGLYQNENNNYIKRALAVAVQTLPRPIRNRFYADIENDSYDMKRLVKYLKQERIETI